MKKHLLLVIGISLFNFISCTESKILNQKAKKVVSVRNTAFKKSNDYSTLPKTITNSVDNLQLIPVKPISKFDELRALHACYLSESPYKETLKKTKRILFIISNVWKSRPRLGRQTIKQITEYWGYYIPRIINRIIKGENK